MEVALADHAIMVVLRFLERAWPWARDRLEKVLGYDLRMAEGGHGLLYPLTGGIANRIRRVGINQIFSGTRYSPVRALVAVLCSLELFGLKRMCWGGIPMISRRVMCTPFLLV